MDQAFLNQQQIWWDHEYQNDQEVPTSTKTSPSQSITFLQNYLKQQNIPLQGFALDVGCGSGRNTLYLAKQGLKVAGLDISSKALTIFRQNAKREQLLDDIQLLCQSMDAPIPLPGNSCDFILCTTTIENLIKNKQILAFQQEVFRLLKISGFVLLYFLTPSDGFYGPLVSNKKSNSIVHVPQNGMTQRVYSQEEMINLWQPTFTICQTKTFQFPDTRFGQTYPRHLVGMILQKSTDTH